MRSNKLIFASACLGMLLFGIGLITLGSVASGLQQKFQLDAIAAGGLFSILPIGILLGSLLFGPFSDRYGYKIFLLLSAACMFAGFQGIANAASLNLLKFCVFLFGFGGGAINGASNAIVSDISTNNKGANLSLLGVFFAIGALGMPFVLGLLAQRYAYQEIVSFVGYLPLFAMVMFILTRFPAPKQLQGIPLSKGAKLLLDPLLLLIGFFLFCQTSFEAIINNWTTTYLVESLPVSSSQALYALSLYVAGMATMRIIIGSFLRKTSSDIILLLSFLLAVAGCSMLRIPGSYPMALCGLILTGAGLAAGFPVMLGFIGDRYAELSGTAFSLVLTIAMIGNMTINYVMGFVVTLYGIQQLTTVTFIMMAVMLLLTLAIRKRI